MSTPWSESKPVIADALSELPSVLTQHATAFREGIEQHFNWTDSSGLSAGEPRFSSLTTQSGSARAFFDSNAQVNSTRNGTLQVSNDTKRLFSTAAAGVAHLGSVAMIIADGLSAATIAAGVRWKVQSGQAAASSGVTTRVAFTAYNGTPYLEATLATNDSTFTSLGVLAITQIDSSGFSYYITKYGAGSTNYTIYWRSEGTVAL